MWPLHTSASTAFDKCKHQFRQWYKFNQATVTPYSNLIRAMAWLGKMKIGKTTETIEASAESVNASAPILACKSTISQTKLPTFSFNLFCRCSCGTRRFLKNHFWKLFFFLACLLFSGDMAHIRMWALSIHNQPQTPTQKREHTHDYNFHTIETLIIMWTCRHTKHKK